MSFSSEFDDDGTLIVERTFTGLPVRLLWKAWREDWHLQGWWPEEVRMNFRVGGQLCWSWPSLGVELRGRFLEIQTEKLLAFTWTWGHDPEDFPIHTTIRFLEEDEQLSTRLRIEQRAFVEDEDGEAVARLLEGWEHFLTRLEDYVAQMTLV